MKQKHLVLYTKMKFVLLDEVVKLCSKSPEIPPTSVYSRALQPPSGRCISPVKLSVTLDQERNAQYAGVLESFQNHSPPRLPVHGKNISREISSWCPKGWEPLV